MKKVAIVLGGTTPHIELIRNLEKRGFYTLLIDYYSNPPAKKYADEHLQESTLDADLVLKIAKERNARLVISTCIDQANKTATYVSEALDLPSPYSSKVAEEISKKTCMKEMMRLKNIPTSKFVPLNSLSSLDGLELKFPLIVKPSDCTGSKGVVKVLDQQSLIESTRNALDMSPTNTAVVEEWVEGEEIQVDYFVLDGVPHRLMSRQKIKINPRYSNEQQVIGSLVPANLSLNILEAIDKSALSIVEYYGLKNSPLFVQAIVGENGINIIEFAPRIGGGLSFSLLKHVTRIDVIDLSISALLGELSSISPTNTDYMFATLILYATEGVYKNIVGVDRLVASGDIEDFFSFKETNSVIGKELSSKNRIAALIVKGNTFNEIEIKKNRILSLIDVKSVDGRSMFLREIFLQ